MKTDRTYVHAARGGRAALVAAMLIGCTIASNSTSAQMPDVITIAVPPEGTTGYLMAAGYSKVINAQTPIKKTILQPFASASAWPVRMNTGDVNFSQHCGFEQVVEAYRGTGPFKSVGPQPNIRNVATTYGLPWTVHVVDPAVKSLADLKGHSIFVQVSHTDHVNALRVMLKAVGLDYDRDIKVLPFREPGEAVQGMAVGRGDAMAFGLIPALLEVRQSKGLHSLAIPPEIAKQIDAADPVWGATVIRKGTGPTAPAENLPVLELECGIAAGAQTKAETVYEVLKAILDHHDAWQGVHPLAKQTTLKKALQISVVPYHEGAVRYYSERGLWNEELAAKQKALLAK